MCRKPETIRVTHSEKIAIVTASVLLVIVVSTSIYTGIYTIGKTIRGVCQVLACASDDSGSGTQVLYYTFPKGDGRMITYNASFIVPSSWNYTCSDNLVCSYNLLDPEGTFGGWVDVVIFGQLQTVCINGACLIQNTINAKIFNYSVVFCISLVMFLLYLIIKITTRPPKMKFDSLYKAIEEGVNTQPSGFDSSGDLIIG